MERPFSSLAGIYYCAIALALCDSLGNDSGLVALAAMLAKVLFSSSIAFWVLADARRQSRSVPYDFDTLTFFLWPVLAPLYLFSTRGWRAFHTIFGFLMLVVVSSLLGKALALVILRRH